MQRFYTSIDDCCQCSVLIKRSGYDDRRINNWETVSTSIPVSELFADKAKAEAALKKAITSHINELKDRIA